MRTGLKTRRGLCSKLEGLKPLQQSHLRAGGHDWLTALPLGAVHRQFRPMLGATRCCKQALWQPKAGQCQSQALPANFDRVLQEEQEAGEWILQLMSTDGLYEWHSSLPCSVSECMLSLCRPAYLQSRRPGRSLRSAAASADSAPPQTWTLAGRMCLPGQSAQHHQQQL